ncbi:hypothetical protein MOC25_19565 [Bacillus subtilis]|nr:hypothetical protein [Bacillus subtilis]MCY8201826.1 hypothetical protein [Bacillus subtilis]
MEKIEATLYKKEEWIIEQLSDFQKNAIACSM